MVATERVSAKGAVLSAALMAVCAAGAVEIRESAEKYVVTNPHYALTFEAKKGWTLRSVAYGGDRRNVFLSLHTSNDGQHEVFNGRPHDAPLVHGQGSAAVTAEVVSKAADKVVVRFAWKLPDGGEVKELVTFDDTPVVRYAVDYGWVRSAYELNAFLQSLQINPGKTVFLPENRTFTGVYMKGERSILPRWKYLTDGKFGVGLVAPYGEAWDHFDFQARTQATGTAAWGPQTLIWLKSDALANRPAPGKGSFRFAAVFTKDAALAFKSAVAELKGAPAVQLCDIEPDKVFSEKGKRNGLTTTIVNNTAEERTVKTVVELCTGLADVRKISEETLTLKPGEMRVYKKDWDYPEGFEWGVASRVKVYDGDTLLDARSDVVSVADRGFAAAGCGIVNCKANGQDGAEIAWADELRRTYIGMVEYYMWSPSTWDPDRKAGQAPVADSWNPVSEHSATKTVLTKKFLKGFIDNCHQRGIHVYDWITGLVNYRQAVAHPEMFQYAKNGQLLLYSGKVHGKERHAVAKIAPYTVEQAAEWGDQTADSVDMFGWDGCRWDWGFLPCAPNDPLYMNELGLDPEKFTWYDWKGRPSTELYPDPDTVGTECLKAFRAAVNKRHPKFVDTANAHTSADAFRLTPKYMKERTRDSLALNEYLMAFTGRNKTYRSWGDELAEANMRGRENGSHSEVGHISGFLENSVGGQLARFVCGAAGSKWWGGPADYRYWTAKHRSLPFAMRFSEYFFGLDFVRFTPEEAEKLVKVESASPLYWKPFVYARTKDGRREMIAHVVNCPPDKIIYEKQADVKPVTDLAVTAPEQDGKAPTEAWAMLPGDEPVAVKLALDGRTARVPKLEEACCVLFRY